MAREIIKLKNVDVSYNGTPVLDNISLKVLENDFLGIIGPNGGGKTTLLKVILGLIKPSGGSVTVLGQQPARARKHIGYVPQYNVFDRRFPISVMDAVMMGRLGACGLVSRFSARDREMAEQALETVGMLAFRNQQIGELSGGEQQRVFIARALATEPSILLLDEPTASVDPTVQTEFYDLLDGLKERMAIVLVSHDISAVSVHVQSIACLNRQLHYHGPKEISAEILEQTYKCPVQLIAHGTIPHRVLKEH